MAKSVRLQLRKNIYGHYRSIFSHCDVIGEQSNRIWRKTQNKGYYAVQGHPGRDQLPVCYFLLVINSIDREFVTSAKKIREF